jgi:hypothetical protein
MMMMMIIIVIIAGLESREYGRRNPSRRPHGTLYPQKLAVTLPTGGGRSVGMVRWRGLRPRSLGVFYHHHHCRQNSHLKALPDFTGVSRRILEQYFFLQSKVVSLASSPQSGRSNL